MYGKLISHSWQMFRRSVFFEKSMFAKGIIAFVIFFLVMNLYGLGRSLPVLLNEQFPDLAPAEWVYGVLPLFMLGDLFMRFFIQKVPAGQVMPYMHLPVSKSSLSGYRISRSWLHPINFYLLFFFYPFIQMTINPATSSQELGLLGVFLLVGVNHSILMLIRTPGKENKWLGYLLVIVLLAMGVGYLLFPEKIMDHSLQVFMAFVYAKPVAFLIPVFVIVVLQYIVYRQTIINFYQLYEAGEKVEKPAARNIIETLLASVPVYGPYWLLEWRLLLRNRRTKSSLYTFLPMAVAFALYAGFRVTEPGQSGVAIVYILIAGGIGSMHLQHAFSWESYFFDYIASRDFPMEIFVRAKYYFYLLIGGIQFILISILLAFLNIDMMLFFAGMSLYSMGMGFYLYLRAGIRHSSRMDLQGNASFNMEGVSGMKMLMGMLQFFIILPLVIIGFLLPVSHGGALLPAIAGIIFLVSHRRWTRKLGQRMEARKYINLAIYREK
ncbi:MAG: DUF5687 family protein [Bacteroidales bacterium]